jgi:hypothetical protein
VLAPGMQRQGLATGAWAPPSLHVRAALPHRAPARPLPPICPTALPRARVDGLRQLPGDVPPDLHRESLSQHEGPGGAGEGGKASPEGPRWAVGQSAQGAALAACAPARAAPTEPPPPARRASVPQVNNSTAFSAVWRVLKVFVDAGTRDKIKVLGSGDPMLVSRGRGHAGRGGRAGQGAQGARWGRAGRRGRAQQEGASRGQGFRGGRQQGRPCPR